MTPQTGFTVVFRSRGEFSTSQTQAFLTPHQWKKGVIPMFSKTKLQGIYPTIQIKSQIEVDVQTMHQGELEEITLPHLLLQHFLPILSQKVVLLMMLLLFFPLLFFPLLFIPLLQATIRQTLLTHLPFLPNLSVLFR